MFTDSLAQLDAGTRSLLAPTISTNVVDLETLRRLGVNDNSFGDFLVKTTFACATASATATLELISTPFTAGGTYSNTAVTATTSTNVISGVTAHGLAPLTPVVFSNVGASGLTAGAIYYVAFNAAYLTDSFQVSSTLANAIAGTAASISSTVTGTITITAFPSGLAFTSAATNTGDTYAQPSGVVLPNGTAVVYHRAITSGVSGISAGDIAFVTNSTSTTFQLASTFALARTGDDDVTVTTGDGTALFEVVPVVLASSGAIPIKHLEAGAHVGLRFNGGLQLSGSHSGENLPVFRYVAARVTPSAVCTAGKIEINLGLGNPEQRQYFPHRLSF